MGFRPFRNGRESVFALHSYGHDSGILDICSGVRCVVHGEAYREDIRKSPDLFKGASRFLAGAVLFLMLVAVIKILYRLSS